MRITLLIVCILVADMLVAQRHSHLTGKVLDPARYAGIRQSPYLFPEFRPATLVPISGEPISGVAVNFNGYTGLFEIEVERIRLDLEVNLLMGIQLTDADSLCGFPTFLRLQHPRLSHAYPLFVYQGTQYKLLKDFQVVLASRKDKNQSNPSREPTFVATARYYLMTGAHPEPVRLNSADMLKRFPGPEVQAYVTTHGLDLHTEAGVCHLLAWLESNR